MNDPKAALSASFRLVFLLNSPASAPIKGPKIIPNGGKNKPTTNPTVAPTAQPHNSPASAPIKGPKIIPNGGKNKPTIKPTVAPTAPALVPPKALVPHMGMR